MNSRKTRPTGLEPASASGRVVQDDRGNSIWECKTDTGNFRRDVDTQSVLNALDNSQLMMGEDNVTGAASTFNPYDQAGKKRASERPRKSLDDLRKLSEQIKQAKHWGGSRK